MSISLTDISYWLAATHLEGIGSIRLRRWLQHFGDIKIVFSAATNELQLAGLSAKQIFSLKNVNWHTVERDLIWCEKNNCQLISLVDARYPVLLREVPDAPVLLYVRGDVNLLSQSQLAIVGSRHPTTTGIETAEKFAHCLAQAGLVVTSGMALGIDAASHRGALAANGKTIAVVGTGLQNIYPASHRQLAENILSQGAIISEFSPQMGARAQNFPMRNRVISGMSLGVLVVEAAVKSGSLITARFAMEQNREVFAIPGSIYNPLARGCHQLIRQGAKLIETTNDIFEELGALHAVVVQENKMQNQSESLSKPCQQLLQYIGYEVTALDTICMRSKMAMADVASLLLMLELEGLVVMNLGGYMRQS